MSLELAGSVIKILEPQTFASGKKKFTFVLETSGQYPQKVPFEVWNEEKWNQMHIAVGQNLSVSFEPNGSEWNGRYFVSLRCWKVVPLDASNNAAPTQPQPQVQTPAPPPQPAPANNDDTLPF